MKVINSKQEKMHSCLGDLDHNILMSFPLRFRLGIMVSRSLQPLPQLEIIIQQMEDSASKLTEKLKETATMLFSLSLHQVKDGQQSKSHS